MFLKDFILSKQWTIQPITNILKIETTNPLDILITNLITIDQMNSDHMNTNPTTTNHTITIPENTTTTTTNTPKNLTTTLTTLQKKTTSLK
jgi:hypothetical protein